MKKLFVLALLAGCYACAQRPAVTESIPDTLSMSKEVLMDKIKGGWAGQAIGCTYGGPTEFRSAEP